MSLAEIVICEIEGNRSIKVFNLFAESVRQTREAAAMHPQCVILFFDVRRRNARNVWHTRNNRPLGFYHVGRAVTAGCILVEIRD